MKRIIKNRKEAYYNRKVCYCCEKPYEQAHSFYKEMCHECGEFNLLKRQQRTDLRGYRALVTGGRVKIGFETAKLLLEMGADVVITTRFPRDAYKRYEALHNFSEFKHHLQIIGVDFRNINSIHNLILYIKDKPLDILINNAAQTVRRPAPYYRHLLKDELLASPCENIISLYGDEKKQQEQLFPHIVNQSLNSAAMSQLKLLPEDNICNPDIFPPGKLDKDGQQIDLRKMNSWMYQFEEIPILELYEVLQINLVAPVILTQQLMPLLMHSGRKSYVINVSAMEGNFFAPRKNSRHVHTNIAKAGLNMLTRTVSSHLKQFNIFMNSVDTGWITNEKPNPQNLGPDKRKTIMAIDETDGAMRILDPIIRGIGGSEDFGKLFKNYHEYPW